MTSKVPKMYFSYAEIAMEILALFCLLGSVTAFAKLAHPMNRAFVEPTLKQGRCIRAAPNDRAFPISSCDEWKLTELEKMCAVQIEEWYLEATTIKCPFAKRRLVDALDALDAVLRFLVIRHKSLDLFGPPPGCRGKFHADTKTRGLSMEELLQIIQDDWRGQNGKGYYITGNLHKSVYRDDCLFDGPDPDMPVRGLRKYANAASQLFDRSLSHANLLSLTIASDSVKLRSITARWSIQGILRLPWKPKLPQLTGTTTYYIDDEGLIYMHQETWDISVIEAFMRTFFPKFSLQLWRSGYNC